MSSTGVLQAALKIRLNLEMANAPEIVRVALAVKPEEVCLVPEKRQELTTEGGLDVVGQRHALRPTVAALKAAGIVVSLFVEADRAALAAAAELGASYVELHTGTYCDAKNPADRMRELDRLVDGARFAQELGLKVNAGHGINLDNLAGILSVPHLDTLNIGHSLVCRAVFVGLEQAVREMLNAMAGYGAEAR